MIDTQFPRRTPQIAAVLLEDVFDDGRGGFDVNVVQIVSARVERDGDKTVFRFNERSVAVFLDVGNRRLLAAFAQNAANFLCRDESVRNALDGEPRGEI